MTVFISIIRKIKILIAVIYSMVTTSARNRFLERFVALMWVFTATSSSFPEGSVSLPRYTIPKFPLPSSHSKSTFKASLSMMELFFRCVRKSCASSSVDRHEDIRDFTDTVFDLCVMRSIIYLFGKSRADILHETDILKLSLSYDTPTGCLKTSCKQFLARNGSRSHRPVPVTSIAFGVVGLRRYPPSLQPQGHFHDANFQYRNTQEWDENDPVDIVFLPKKNVHEKTS